MSGVSYSLRIKASAAKALARVPANDRVRLIEAIDSLRDAPLRGSVLKGDLRGLRRVRVGDYRIVYEVTAEDLVVLVVQPSPAQEIGLHLGQPLRGAHVEPGA